MSNFKKTLVTSLSAACVMGFAAHAAQAVTVNGFANGGFENSTGITPLPPGGVTSFAANWLSAPTGFPVTLSTDARTGAYSALLRVPTGFGGATMFQNSMDHGQLPALTTGDAPMLSFWAKGDASTTGNVGFNLRYLDGVGNILSNQSGNQFQNAINAISWTQITLQGNVVPVGAVAAFLEMTTAVGPILDGRPNAVLIDDLYFGVTAVPEPGTYALLLAGLAGIGTLVRRRQA